MHNISGVRLFYLIYFEEIYRKKILIYFFWWDKLYTCLKQPGFCQEATHGSRKWLSEISICFTDLSCLSRGQLEALQCVHNDIVCPYF